jgi:DNA-binding transcriptional LysR family regulator
VSGTIRIATIYSIGLHELPPYMTQFLKSHPNVNVHVEFRRVNQVYEDVLGNVVDLGLVAYPEKSGKQDWDVPRPEFTKELRLCHAGSFCCLSQGGLFTDKEPDGQMQ